MLSGAELQELHTRGFVRLPAAFSVERAAAMEERIWSTLGERHAMLRDDPTSWARSHAVGLQALREEPVFAPIGGAVTLGAIDAVLGAQRWKKPRHWGQLLISFPTDETAWHIPSGVWHTDFGFLGSVDELAGVLVFAFISRVPPRCGGTLVVSGSHRVVRAFVERQPIERRQRMKRVRKAFFRSDPWLEALCSDPEDPNREERFMQNDHEISGTPVRVLELTGEPGDVVLAHPWLVHTSSPNCGTQPRMMCVQRVRTIDAPPDSLSRSGDDVQERELDR